MKYPWLEKFAAEGHIRKEVLENIYKDVDSLIKEGAGPDAKTKAIALALTGGAMLGLGIAGTIGGNAVSNRLDEAAGRKKLLESRDAVLETPAFAGHEGKARQLFNEIATYAPHVAMNTPLATRFIQAKLSKGLTGEDIMQLALLQSQHMPNVVRQDKYMPKLGSMRPEKYGEIIADVYCMAKTAMGPLPMGDRAKNFLVNLGMLSGASLAIGALTGLTNTALDKLDKRKLNQRLEDSFQKAMSLETKNSEYLRANKDKARQAFSALAHFAPQVALEPQAAHSFMGKIVSYDQGMNVDDIKALAEIQKNMVLSQKPSPMAEGFMGAHKVFNMGSQLGDALSTATSNMVNEGMKKVPHKHNEGDFRYEPAQ